MLRTIHPPRNNIFILLVMFAAVRDVQLRPQGHVGGLAVHAVPRRDRGAELLTLGIEVEGARSAAHLVVHAGEADQHHDEAQQVHYFDVLGGSAVTAAASPTTRPAGLPAMVVTMPSSISSYSDRKSTRLNSSHQIISYAVFCLK